MALHAITDPKRISKCQKNFASHLKKMGESRSGNVGHQGDNDEMSMYWFSEYGFWWSYYKLENRYWNVFGIDEPLGNNLSMTCQINFPTTKQTWQIAGAFAEDDEGQVYIVHSGKIGGGRKDIGLGLFRDNYSGGRQWKSVERNGKPKDVVVVSPLDASLVQNLGMFVKEVDRIKKLAHPGKTRALPPVEYRRKSDNAKSNTPSDDAYSREFGGLRKPHSIKDEIRANAEHGNIVHGIYGLAAETGLDVWNNQQTDLVLRRKNIALVEVKTDSTPYSRYTAIGQLLYHSKDDDHVLVAVFPSIDDPFKRVLNRLDIVGVTWRKDGSKYKFGRDLYDVMKRL